MIGIDTTVIVDLFRGLPEIRKKLENLNQPLCVTRLTYLELMFGLDITKDEHKKEATYYDEFFKAIQLFELDQKSCKKAGEIYQTLKKNGRMIDEFDCTIAATFITQGVNTILTKNTKHFQNIPQIKVIEY